jgi:hypothetical protein
VTLPALPSADTERPRGTLHETAFHETESCARAAANQRHRDIRGKLATVDHEIAAAEADLRRASLDAVIGEDPTVAESAVAHLRQLRARRELLHAALQGALDAEDEAQAELRNRDWQTRKRALAQHIGRAQRDAKDLTDALVAVRDAFRRLAGTGQSITALLPPSLRTVATPFHEMLGQNALRGLVNVEAYRLSRDGLPAPGATERPPLLAQYEDRTGAIEPLAEIVGELLELVRTAFDHTAPAKPQTSPLVTTPPVLSAPAPLDAIPPLLGVVLRSGEIVDLRGEDLGVEKSSADSDESMETANV